MENPVENHANPPTTNGSSWFARIKKEVERKLLAALFVLLKMILSLMTSTALTKFISFVCWFLYFHPHKLHPEVDSAVLVALDLVGGPRDVAAVGGGGGADGSHALLYDLDLNVTFANKFTISRIHFQHLTAGLYYGGAKIGPTDDTVPSFKLRQEASRTVWFRLRGRASNVSASVAETYAREHAQGQFNVNVVLRTMLTYKFFPNKISYYYHYDCGLPFPPVPGDGTPAVTGAFECIRGKSKY